MKSIKNKQDEKELDILFKAEINKRNDLTTYVSFFGFLKMLYYGIFVPYRIRLFAILVIKGMMTYFAWKEAQTLSKKEIYEKALAFGWEL